MAIDATFTVNGVAVSAAVAVAASSTVTLAVTNTSGINLVVWSVEGNDRAGHVNPTIASSGTPQGSSASFTMPADAGDGLGQSYLVQAVATDGGGVSSTFRAVIGVVNNAGVVPIAAGEESERSASHGWIEVVNAAASLLSTTLKLGTNLGDTSPTITVAGGSRYIMPAGTMTTNRSVTLGTAGATASELIEIIRLDKTAFTLAIVNGGGGAGTKYTFPVSVSRRAWFTFDGTNWALTNHAAVV